MPIIVIRLYMMPGASALSLLFQIIDPQSGCQYFLRKICTL